MGKRFVSIWFRHLTTDWFSLRQPELRDIPFVLRTPSHGRMVITSVNAIAKAKGVHVGMVLADARAIIPELEVRDDPSELIEKLLHRLAEWCIRFSPFVAVDATDGLIIDATGCTHLWGGDEAYISDIIRRLRGRHYDVRAAMADTAAVACAVARYGTPPLIIPPGMHREALLVLPPESLRLEHEAVMRLHKLGLHKISQFVDIPRQSLRRRFGPAFLTRLDMALGHTQEALEPVFPVEAYQERLPCMEPILTAEGIAIALEELLKTLCYRLQQEQKGMRNAIFKCYRVDGIMVQIDIATNRPSHHVQHLFRLFSLKIQTIEPALGIELFVLEAPKVEDHLSQQEKIWEGAGGLEDERLSELIDRLSTRVGMKSINRFVPDEHYWPERSLKAANTLTEKPSIDWRTDKLRPTQLLQKPERIEVTAPIPDYPPMLFIHHGKIHKIVKADGPERIEQEWWLQEGQHRDYYRVEDEEGQRYWLFRLGHYDDKVYQWYVHGVFA
jgi:protein ImuB